MSLIVCVRRRMDCRLVFGISSNESYCFCARRYEQLSSSCEGPDGELDDAILEQHRKYV